MPTNQRRPLAEDTAPEAEAVPSDLWRKSSVAADVARALGVDDLPARALDED